MKRAQTRSRSCTLSWYHGIPKIKQKTLKNESQISKWLWLKTTSQRVKVNISKSQKLTKQQKNLGLKKKWLHQDTTLVVLIVLWDPGSRLAQANNSTGSPEHGARVEEPRHFRTAAWKPNVVFCFSETSNWNTIFVHITQHFFTTCWICLIWMYLLAMGSLYFSNKGFTLKSSVSSFHRRDLGLAQVGQFTQSISAHSLVPQTFGRKSPFSATKIYLSLSDKITTESSTLKTWESEHSPKQVTSVLKWCFETWRLLRDENHHTSVHWATLFFSVLFGAVVVFVTPLVRWIQFQMPGGDQYHHLQVNYIWLYVGLRWCNGNPLIFPETPPRYCCQLLHSCKGSLGSGSQESNKRALPLAEEFFMVWKRGIKYSD